jgi:hypothetical protein
MYTRRSRPSSWIETGTEAPSNPAADNADKKWWMDAE